MQDIERSSSRFEHHKVSDFMSRTGIVVGPHATLAEAETYFEKYDFNLLPVVDRLRLMGVLTKTDFLKAFCVGPSSVSVPYEEVANRQVETFMTPNPKTFSPQSSLQKVLEEMVATRHRSFVVVEGDQFVGVISREDIIRALRQRRGEPSRRSNHGRYDRDPAVS